jgi:hypothetical protein
MADQTGTLAEPACLAAHVDVPMLVDQLGLFRHDL